MQCLLNYLSFMVCVYISYGKTFHFILRPWLSADQQGDASHIVDQAFHIVLIKSSSCRDSLGQKYFQYHNSKIKVN